VDLTTRFRRAVRAALDFADPDGAMPAIDRLAFYECEVKAVAQNGETVDLQPLDPRIRPHQGVPVRTGVPGVAPIVKTGSTALLGWETGNPGRPYVPAWLLGAGVAKLVVKADMVFLGDESGAEALVKKSEFVGHTHDFGTLQCPNTGTGAVAITGATAGAATITGTTNVQAK
jgi:hypothetical protein